jgi:hypothetical protein
MSNARKTDPIQLCCNCSPVIPAKAGIHPAGPTIVSTTAETHPDSGQCRHIRWIPAFAGMTGEQLRFVKLKV